MNLKKIEAYGFKSFADKLGLDFNNGVTCIVGPNGCGKSNVSDAIRWVLGEQSPKNLRGKSMQEVIFNGTDSRRPSGFCEVSLFFDNSQRVYEWDADEIVIKRKLWRTGDSEYYINNTTVRLKDILDLFRDTGIGKDGYSVIGQGKVDSFLSAKPEDRRQIFEEAAGISKYKARRNESQRKLERANDSMLRIKDKIDVYEQRMAPLEKQAKEALKAREIKEKLKYDEINHFVYLTESGAVQRQQVQERLNRVSESLAEAERTAERLAKEYAEAQETSKELDGAYKRLSDEKLNVSIRISQKNGRNDLNLQKLEQLKAECERLSGDIEEKTKAIGYHTASREAAIKEQERTIVERIAADQESKDIDARYIAVSDEVTRQSKEIDVTNEMLLNSADMWGKINGDLSKLKAEIEILEKNVETNETALSAKRTELKAKEKSLADVNAELERLRADRDEKADIKRDIDRQYAEKNASYNGAQDSYIETRDTIASLKTRIEFLEKSKNSYNNFDLAVQTLMNNSDSRVKEKVLGVVGNVISTSQQFSTAIEVALGGNISNMITADQQDTSFLIDYLNKTRGGRGTFLPLSAMRPRPLEDQYMDALDEDGCYGIAADLVKYDRKFRLAIETLLGRVVVVDTKDTAVKMLKKYRGAFRIVTLDGAHYAINGSVSGGQKNAKDNRMLSVEAELTDAKRNLSNQLRIMEVITAETEEMRKTLKDMDNTSKVLDGIIGKLVKDIAIAEERSEHLTDDCDRLTAEAKVLQDALDNDKREIAVKTQLFAVENSKIDSTSNARVDANELLNKLASQLNDKKTELNEISEKRTEIILKVRQLENKLTELERTIDTSDKTVTRLNTEIAEETSQLRVKESESKHIAAELERIAAEQADDEELNKIQEQLDGLDNRKWELEKQQNALRFEEQRNNKNLADFAGAKAKAEAALERIESDLQQAGDKVREEYELDYEGALAFKDPDYDDERGMQDAKNLRRELAKLGEINEKAVEDLAELTEEYQALKVHYDDINTAILSLVDTIKDLTEKMELNFAESFAKIKVNFAEVFTELFGGGRGMLDLDMERGMSVLDAGIVIAAEPPGKRLQNIDLLSGGERAMTAIALIFAIIKLHPMPFCVLDEVDAPLDESNAAIYARYLKKFSKDTQFIIISHRKPTMELADQLYGITMQEKGVSKFFTVKLSDALKMAKQG